MIHTLVICCCHAVLLVKVLTISKQKVCVVKPQGGGYIKLLVY